MTKSTHSFQAETNELLHLMIHSLYSHREIFLRELISNASDAIEKLKFESLTQPDLLPSGSEFEIRLQPDEKNHQLTISDNGIGMTQAEAIQYLGTIAQSGTKAFVKMRKELEKNPDMIGQFGVGFYSAFMVADKVTVHTQKAGTQTGVVWESTGNGTYTIEEKPRPEGRGTSITLHLKAAKDKDEEAAGKSLDDEGMTQDFTSEWVLKDLVKKYSDFVSYPIKMKTEKEVTPEKAEGDQSEPKTETVVEDQVLNSQKALWLRSSSEITQKEYNDFYRHLSHGWVDPLKTVHYRAEGTMEFSSILFVPAQKPFNYDYRDRKVGLSLYVKRVFIKSDCHELLPPYMRFIQGVVDSDDLVLNVSRELLQQDRQILKIKKALTSKVLSILKDLLEQDRPNYQKFWDNFGTTLKEGIAGEPGVSGSQEKLQELLLFRSTHSTELTSLKEYFDRMKPDQQKIYYITGDHLSQIQNSPYLEKLRAKGYEVLLMTDPIDAWVVGQLRKYNDKELQSIASADLDLNSAEEKKAKEEELKEASTKLKPLLDSMTDRLKEKVKEVRLSDRLTDSPVCLVSSSDESSAHMERLMKAMGQSMPTQKRIMEINPGHPLYEKMLKAPKNLQEDWTDILYQQALLNEGSIIENPMEYSQKIANLMVSASI